MAKEKTKTKHNSSGECNPFRPSLRNNIKATLYRLLKQQVVRLPQGSNWNRKMHLAHRCLKYNNNNNEKAHVFFCTNTSEPSLVHLQEHCRSKTARRRTKGSTSAWQTTPKACAIPPQQTFMCEVGPEHETALHTCGQTKGKKKKAHLSLG